MSNILLSFNCLDNKVHNYIPLPNDTITQTQYYENLIDCDSKNFINIREHKYIFVIIDLGFDINILTRYLIGEYNIQLIEIMMFFMDSRSEDLIRENLFDITNNKYPSLSELLLNSFSNIFKNHLKFECKYFEERENKFLPIKYSASNYDMEYIRESTIMSNKDKFHFNTIKKNINYVVHPDRIIISMPNNLPQFGNYTICSLNTEYCCDKKVNACEFCMTIACNFGKEFCVSSFFTIKIINFMCIGYSINNDNICTGVEIIPLKRVNNKNKFKVEIDYLKEFDYMTLVIDLEQ